MVYFWIFPNCNLDTDDYVVIDTENSTKGVTPLKYITNSVHKN